MLDVLCSFQPGLESSFPFCLFFFFSQTAKAASALLSFVEKSQGKELSLLKENEMIWLIVGLKKVSKSSVKPKRM